MKNFTLEKLEEKNTRMKEHKKDITNLSNSSNIVKHVIKQNHSFDFNEVESLIYENNWNRRIIKESLYTYQSLNLALNDVKYKLNVYG